KAISPEPRPGFPISKRIRNSSNAKEFLNVSLTGNGILLISKRTRNSSNAKDYFNVSLTGNGILLIRGIRE
ncbi:MAG: hypothetical protein AB7C92_06725, partial [Synergistaceae bacterium]